MRPIALTCGEPAGVGPELAVKAWETLGARLPFVYLGDPSHLPQGTPVAEISQPEQALSVVGRGLPVLAHDFGAPATPGTPVPDHAKHVIATIETATHLAQSGAVSAICTGPINKKALKDGANFAHPGHTEFLAALAGVDQVVMMLACPQLRVVPATIHIALSEVPKALTADGLRTTLKITHAELRKYFSLKNPRIAVAGLNPHAGEGGAMGREEITLITPVINDLRAEGLAISGPHSADTMFHDAARGHYDAAVCMYHDQALIPIKTLDFAGGVNVTLGLPFIRTSPDHGTAFDIAGSGRADPSSLIAALKMAQDMAFASAVRV
ncbi:4-hydroxythreonine-4-phosphate dehydrogenase PdxA [Meridianimarinicoccus aquatilis]|uniref:4-hydroxythreonine-4-phosphate dehydrogenase n=1 Tax=Meridianimarinicoccus aquatilis TaxID=2552766 RepID=A0A4R6AQV4_9RHOB|nr:4-hydroxythreonine-4-phosphate dehydrogenase PdxA [Fluviibacterium aquatile]QIE42851.1 4-hydroxythreonine-4-phosphate dehydrogenase PdxA [Rhodobacteraceae bacterium SC52]TDL86440.1 4-hydroxythreonine-4-phosphate dehydrogenase PdxA [Fluviibacterium aquatile]